MSAHLTQMFKEPSPRDNPLSFAEACQKIKSDPNYQPGISNGQLFDLVMNEDGTAKHSPRKSALAILPFETRHALVTAYQITIARKGVVGDEDIPRWHIDDSTCIVVSQKGQYSFYKTEDVEKAIFTSPLTHLSIERFLGQECLHDSNQRVSNRPQPK